MLRWFFIYLSKASWARSILTNWKFAWNVASRFVAGDKLEDGIRVIQELNKNGLDATLDHLGEDTTSEEEAAKATNDIIEILDVIQESGVCASVSIKLTQIGLKISESVCETNLQKILERALKHKNFVRIDMEDSSCVDSTLALVQKMRNQHGFKNCGVVIQAYLYRSEEDVRKLVKEGVPIRLCKGAYKEPADIAFPKKADVDTNFDTLTEIILEGTMDYFNAPGREDCFHPPIPAIGTHDPARIAHAKSFGEKINFPKDAMEFQMLYGIRRDLQIAARKEGYHVRIYVPFGTEWYPYFMRRLAERPANVWFFISNFFRK